MEPGQNDKKKKAVYKWIKIAGLLSFLPFILAAGPMAGYFLGDYLVKRFGLSSYVSAICIILGFLGSAREAVRIVRLALRTENED